MDKQELRDLHNKFHGLKAQADKALAKISKDRDALRVIISEMEDVYDTIGSGVEEAEEALRDLSGALGTMSQLV